MILFRFVIALQLLVLSGGCVTFSDGAFQQVEGRFFDARRVENVVDGQTSEQEILEWFGAPFSTAASGDGAKVLQYYSVRLRTSTEARFLSRKYHRESVTERMTIRVVDGRVASHQYLSQISGN